MNKTLFIVSWMSLVILFFACKGQNATQTTTTQQEEQKHWVKEINSEEFLRKVLDISSYKQGEKLKFKGDKPIIVDFYADWCAPCRRQTPILEKIAQEYEGQIDVYKIDVDKSKDIARFFNVSSIPLLLFVPKGGEIFFYTGLTPMEDLQEAVGMILPNLEQDSLQNKI
ncbi:MAG: thioredoxin [Bacteroidota bacterium]|nr:thioredoxin [Bacteroidota bacterium]